MKNQTTMATLAKSALFGIIFGVILLLGGIPFQIILGMGRVETNGEAEKLVYKMMSQGSLILITGYVLVFSSGIVFWLFGPYSLKRDRWFLIAFLAFYLWLPLDWYFIGLDLRFAFSFDPSQPLTYELKQLFDAREVFAPLPLLTLVGYLAAIGLSIFQPNINGRKNKNV